MKSIIQTHNKTVTKNTNTQPKTPSVIRKDCNCRDRGNCPLDGLCNTGPVVYKASVKDRQGNEHTYIGSSKNFKERYRNHTKSFRDVKYSTETTLSGFVWANSLGPEPEIHWKIMKKAQPYKKGNRYCDLCITEKTLY